MTQELRLRGTLPDDKRAVLRLKNGTDVDARLAYVRWRILESIQKRSPEEMNLLMAFAGVETKEGSELPQMSTEARQYLRRAYADWFESTGELNALVRNVVQSAVRMTSEGTIIVNPFRLSNQTEIDTFLDVQHQDDRLLRRFDRLFFREPDSGGRNSS
jgi:hypothetical protein